MAETEVTKEVTMVAYDADQNYSGTRSWSEKLAEDLGEDHIDMSETEVREERKVEIVVDAGEGEEIFTISKYQYTEEGLESMKDEVGGNRVRVEDETKEEEVNLWDPSDVKSPLLDYIATALDDEFTAAGEQFVVDDQWANRRKWHGENDSVLRIKTSFGQGFEEDRVLAKEDERESDDLYETMAAVPCFKFTIKMESGSHDVIDALSDGAVPKFHRSLSKLGGVGQVRYMACERQETKKGECYDI